jgi:peptide/nickel transport system substrate-binding protein
MTDSSKRESEFSRRSLLGGAGLVAAGLAVPQIMGALPSGASSQFSHSTKRLAGLSALPGGTPVRGGTLTVGVISGGSSENLFPGTALTTPDFCRDYNLYDLLFYTGTDINPIKPGLALSAEPNKDATVWTFKLRSGVVWHDGKPFNADDVVYNFKVLWSNLNLNYSSAILTGIVNFAGVRKIDNLTVSVPLNRSVAQFPTLFTFYNFPIVQKGATMKSTAAHPIGTGPFKYVSFTPGSRSIFKANKNYWDSGKPYVDTLVVDSSFTNTNSILNALLSGSINLFPTLPFVNAREQLTSKQVQILESPVAAESYMFAMRVDKGPFADNRVRQAFKLLVNRQKMIDGAWSGFGTVANDLLCPGTEYYASDLKRTQDVGKAKSLFKAAGVLGHTFVLPTTNFLPGMVESATILAQQAVAAGVKVSVQVKSASTYFTTAGGFGTRPFGQEVNQPAASLLTYYLAEYTKTAPYPDTHWGFQKGGAASENLISQAIAATDPARAKELWHQCQQQQFDQGGYLVWGNAPYVDAAANNVRGLSAGAGFSYNNWRLCDGWIK